MKSKLYEKAVDYIKYSINEKIGIENILYYDDLFRAIKNLIKGEFYEDASFLIDYCIKHFDGKNFKFKKTKYDNGVKNSLYFLDILVLSIFRDISRNKKPNKNQIKILKKIFENLKNSFDENYLLLFENCIYTNEKKFNIFLNIKFLESFEKLDLIFEYLFLEKQREILSVLFDKINLGFNRYFYFEKNQLLIKEFYPKSEKYELCSEKTLIEILLKYNFDNNLLIDLTNKSLKNFEKIEDVSFKLILLKSLKEINYKSFDEKLVSIMKFLFYFPEKIFDKKNQKYINIEKKLFPNLLSQQVEVDDYFLVDLNSFKIVNLVIEIFEDKKF